MHVGILTYHNTTNFGAALQAYALNEALRQDGVSAEIIDYRNGYLSSRNRSVGSSSRWVKKVAREPLRRAFSAMKNVAFSEFSSGYLDVGSRVYYDRNAIESDPPKYDLYLVGSDQVWNYSINGTDPTYFFDFVQDRSRVTTFASSFGMQSVPDDLQQFYRDGLNSISHISVREEMGAELIRKLVGREATVHADPVFLLPPEYWLSLGRRASKRAGTTGLVSYFLASTQTLSVRDGLLAGPLRKFSSHQKFAGGLRPSDLLAPETHVDPRRGPMHFLSDVSRSEFVITDSFHATAFSILMDRPFGTVLSGDPGKDARIVGLLEDFGLSSRVVLSSSQLDFRRPSEQAPTLEVAARLRADGRTYLRMLTSVSRSSS